MITDTNSPTIVWRPALSDAPTRRRPQWTHCAIFAPVSPPRQKIWPTVWRGPKLDQPIVRPPPAPPL